MQEKGVEQWNEIYKSYEKGFTGIAYPSESLIRFVSTLRKPQDMKGYFDDIGKEHSLRNDFVGNVLEIGFGGIANMVMLREKGFKIYGLEVSKEAVKRGKAELRKRGISNISLSTWTPSKLPFKDNHFALICGLQCIYYCLKLEDVLKECHRILKPGGVFMFSFFSNRHGYMKFIDWKDEYPKWSHNHPDHRIRGCCFRQPKTKKELKGLFKMFDEVRIFTYETDQSPLFESWWNITGKKSN